MGIVRALRKLPCGTSSSVSTNKGCSPYSNMSFSSLVCAKRDKIVSGVLHVTDMFPPALSRALCGESNQHSFACREYSCSRLSVLSVTASSAFLNIFLGCHSPHHLSVFSASSISFLEVECM